MYNTLQIRQNIEDVLRKIGKDLIKIGKNLQKFNCTNQGVCTNAEHIEIDNVVINQRVNIDHKEGYIPMQSHAINNNNNHTNYINLDNVKQANLVGIHQHNYINLDDFDNIKHNPDVHHIEDPYV